MFVLAKLLGISAILSIALFTYARWPEKSLVNGVVADRILVLKSEHKLLLLKEGKPLKEYSIALGSKPLGNKQREGDGKTPEGVYQIDYRNAKSQFHRSLHVSYPSTTDMARAKREKASAGGMIMIHGIQNGLGALGRLHRLFDWTSGCLAVTNTEIDEIWRVVPDGTPIEIRP